MTDQKMTPGDLIARYRSIRDTVKTMEDKHKEAIKPYKDGLETIANYLLQLMHEQNVTQFKAESGTAFQKTTMSVHTADKEILMKSIAIDVIMTLGKEYGLGIDRNWADFVDEASKKIMKAFDLLTAAVSKEALQVYMDEHKDVPPPGVDVKFFTEVQIRKPS